MDFVFWFLILVYMEVVMRVSCLSQVFDIGLILAIVYSLLVACIIKFVTSLFKEKVNRILGGVILGFVTFIYIVQATYQNFFGKFLVLYSIFAGGLMQVTDAGMLDATLRAIKNGLPAIVLFLLPFLYYCIFGKKKLKMKKGKILTKILYLLAGVITYLGILIMLFVFPEQKSCYLNVFDMDTAVQDLGLVYAEVLDFKYNVLNVTPPVELDTTQTVELDDTFSEEEEIKYEANIMEIDFETLLAQESDETIQMLHNYFKNSEPTYKNEYTGMFEGYNLIMVTAEGFSPYVVNETLTPTLYKMSTQGFIFENFYTPIWGVSTSDGEYVACTGNLPMSGVWSFYESGDNYMPFCLGNQFEKNGVDLRYAYHNHTYDYYHRHISHPNMGYEYKGLGGGLTEEQIEKTWPESDLQLIEATYKDYVQSEKPFVAYYMTVSGHLEYNRYGNAMANKNWDYVKDLSASEEVKAYYACNIEFDRAMGKLLTELENAGIADKTVIAIAADHYPYGLETDNEEDNYKYFNEILGREIESNFELYESMFILYCASMEEPIVIDKYASNVDILPTLSNLFGLEYDSRILAGKDILSTREGLVIFSNRNWISDRGRYVAATKEFEVFDAETFVSGEEMKLYVEQINKEVDERFQTSTLVLSEDYYSKILLK